MPNATLSIENERMVIRNERREFNLYWHKDNFYFRLSNYDIYELYKNKNGQRMLKCSNARYVTEFMNEKDIN